MPNHNPIGILSTGHFLPNDKLKNQDFVDRGLDTSDEWISSRSGIHTRYISAPNETTSDLATKAAEDAISNGNISLEEIDFIIIATATPDHYGFPSTACIVQKKLGISRHIPAFDISAACSGFAYGISIAYSYINSGIGRFGLVIGAETLSDIVDWSDRSTCVLFGDGAGAVVVGPVNYGRGVIKINQGSNGNDSHILSVIPKQGTETFNQHKVSHPIPSINMDGPSVFKQGIRYVERSLSSLFESCDVSISDISYFVAHQANLRILQSIATKMKIPFDRFLTNIDHVGNTSAASIPLILSESNQDQRFKTGDLICLIGFGAGFTWSSIILEWSNENEKS